MELGLHNWDQEEKPSVAKTHLSCKGTIDISSGPSTNGTVIGQLGYSDYIQVVSALEEANSTCTRLAFDIEPLLHKTQATYTACMC